MGRNSRGADRTARALAALLVTALTMSGCSNADVGSDPNNPDQVEVFTWWASGNEETSFRELTDVFAAENPDIDLIDASVVGRDGTQARAALAVRLESGNPPDSFQAAGGAGLAGYVEADQLQDLTSWYESHDLAEGVYPESVLDLVRIDGGIYSVPTDIHRVNVVWADTSVLTAAGVDPGVAPSSIDGWLADLQQVRASGVEYPLALGNAWTQVQLFENVLIADLGAELYAELWSRPSTWKNDKIRVAVTHYAQLLDFVDPGSGSLEWNDATQQVVQSRAGYVLMADFALIPFKNAGLTYGKQYTTFPAPGTQGVFDMLLDSFTLPVGAVHESAAEAWLLTAASAEGQDALSMRKGSIPARIDTVAADYSPYQQVAIASLHGDIVVPSIAHGVAASAAWTQAITDAVVKFGADGHSQALIYSLTAAADHALG